MVADVIVVIHLVIVVFIVGGVPVVYLGVALHWAWVRRWTWRVVHLGAILFVAAESLLGIACPLYGIVAAPMKSSITEFHRSCHAEA